MIRRGSGSGRRRAAVLGFAVGASTGMTLLTGGVVSASDVPDSGPPTIERGLRDVLHTPPSFGREGGEVTLRFDVVCQADGFGTPCVSDGNVYVRPAGESGYRSVRLAHLGETTLAATVAVPAGGLSYYAVIDDGAGSSDTLPASGAASPQRVWALPDLTTVALGTHVFGHARKPETRPVAAPWGSGAGALGLLTGRELARIGPSAFDLAPDGSIVVLDQANDRLATYGASARPAHYAPIPFGGGEGDLAIGPDGTAYVLEQGAEPVVRTFAPSGAPLAAVPVSGAGVDTLRASPAGASLHGYPGEMWLPVGSGRQLLQPSQQAAQARPSRPDAAGDVVVQANDEEALFALVRGDRVMQAWQVTSHTSLGEIQLAEPYRRGLLVVLRVWRSEKAEFVALVLSPNGLTNAFSVDALEWAESAPLGRFKLDGDRLYQLRSTAAGAEVVAFELGGAR